VVKSRGSEAEKTLPEETADVCAPPAPKAEHAQRDCDMSKGRRVRDDTAPRVFLFVT